MNTNIFNLSFTIDSKTDANGNVLSATGSWTKDCFDALGGGGSNCDTTGTFHLVTPFSPSPSSTGFIRIDSNTADDGAFSCPVGSLLDPFHQNNVRCR